MLRVWLREFFQNLKYCITVINERTNVFFKS